MPNIHAKLVHLPGWKPPKPPSAGARAKTKVKQAFEPKQRAERLTEQGGKFGKMPKVNVKHTNLIDVPELGWSGGIAAGTLGGAAGYSIANRKKAKVRNAEAQKLTQQTAANSKKIRDHQMSKAAPKVHVITDVGSLAGRYTGADLGRATKLKHYTTSTKVALGAGTAVGGLYGVSVMHGDRKTKERAVRAQRARLKKQTQKMDELGISKSAFGVAEEVAKVDLFAPSKVPQGQRKRDTRRGNHKDKPKIGRGQYVKAPLARDKLTKPRWMANSAINNPGSVGSVGALAGAAYLQGKKGQMNEHQRKQADVAQGALIGGAATQQAKVQTEYSLKRRGIKETASWSKRGDFGPYHGPHAQKMKNLQREAQKASGGSARKKKEYFTHNFPKDVPGYGSRKAMQTLAKKPVAAGIVGAGAAVGAGTAAAYDHRKKFAKRDKPLMSDTELRRRKQLQGKISRTTSTLGLGGVAMLGTSLALKKKPGMLKAVPGLKKANPEKLRETAQNIGLVSGGIGGVGGYNFAAYTAAESKKRQKVVKSMDEMAPTYGTEGFAKNWQPVARNYDPESKRQKRAEAYPRIAAAASGVAGAGAAARGLQALDRITDAKAIRAQNAATGARKMYKPLHAAGVKNLKSAGKLGAASVVAGGAAVALNHKKKSKSWEPYAKSAPSAFGVSHD